MNKLPCFIGIFHFQTRFCDFERIYILFKNLTENEKQLTPETSLFFITNCAKIRRIVSNILEPLKNRRGARGVKIITDLTRKHRFKKLVSLESSSVVPTIRQWKSNREQQMCAKHQHSGRLHQKSTVDPIQTHQEKRD